MQSFTRVLNGMLECPGCLTRFRRDQTEAVERGPKKLITGVCPNCEHRFKLPRAR